MFTFRIIEEIRANVNDKFSQIISNHELGKSYSIFEKGASKEFDTILKKKFPDENRNKIRAIIAGENGDLFFVELKTELKNNSYYVMTESGSTYEKL